MQAADDNGVPVVMTADGAWIPSTHPALQQQLRSAESNALTRTQGPSPAWIPPLTPHPHRSNQRQRGKASRLMHGVRV